MFRGSLIFAVFCLAAVLDAGARADLVPVPRAYYDFEEIVDGKFQNVVRPGVFDGYLGVSPENNDRNPTIVTGLFGSSQALKLTGTDTAGGIARVPTLVTDTNADRIDEDVFSGAFTVFARIDTSGVTTAQTHVVNMDRGSLDTTVRGWYFDFNGRIDGKLSPRMNNRPYYNPAGTEATHYQVMESIGISWSPDPNPGGAADGWLQFYINGVPFGEPQAHNHGSVLVGEAGFNIGAGRGVSGGNNIIIDDVAVWDVALTGEQMLAVHAQGVPIPEPGVLVLLGVGGALAAAARPRRRKR